MKKRVLLAVACVSLVLSTGCVLVTDPGMVQSVITDWTDFVIQWGARLVL